MTDRELLELAAKAAGLPVDMTNEGGIGWFACGKSGDGETVWWNPLKSDGDALRLAVKLGIEVRKPSRARTVCRVVQAWYPPDGNPARSSCAKVSVCVDGCKYAATRRAIVRAAAEICRAALAQEGS